MAKVKSVARLYLHDVQLFLFPDWKVSKYQDFIHTFCCYHPQLSEVLKPLSKAEGKIQKILSDYQLFDLFLNFYLFWRSWRLMADNSSSLSASLCLWWHSEIHSRTCSLSKKCLFIFMNVTWSAFQLENQAHLSFVNCKVLNYIQGLICRPKYLQ